MEAFALFSHPWWVNFLIFAPFIGWYFWRDSLMIPKRILALCAVFAMAFGFVESSVVVYLRGAVGLLAECKTKLPDGNIPFDLYRQSHLLNEIPQYFLTIELYREAATIVMLAAVALLGANLIKDRFALFFWTFAFWDIFYYVGLKASINWPKSLVTPDVLFLLPVPWLSQVWFPILISSLFICVVLISQKKK